MKKKILIGALVLIVSVFLILQYNYSFQMKLASLVVENKIEKAIEKIKETIQPTPTPTEATNTTITPTPVKTLKETLNDAINKSQNTPIENNTKFNTAEKSIAKEYVQEFTEIRNDYVSAIEVMVDQAKAEFLAIPEAERNQHKIELGLKYMAQGEILENQCDDQFNATLNRMRADLVKNNLGPGLADTAKLQYEQQKRTVKKALTDKLL